MHLSPIPSNPRRVGRIGPMLDAFVAACGRLRAAAQAARDSILDSGASGSSGRVEPCWGPSQEATATRLRGSLLLLKSNGFYFGFRCLFRQQFYFTRPPTLAAGLPRRLSCLHLRVYVGFFLVHVAGPRLPASRVHGLLSDARLLIKPLLFPHQLARP